MGAGIYHRLGIVAYEQRQWPQSEGYYQQALQIYQEFNDRYEQASTYHNLGNVAEAQRQWQQAEAYFQQALQIYQEYNDRYEQAGTYHQLGMVAQEQRQWEKAQDYFLQSLEIDAEFDDPDIAITLRSLARLWQANPNDNLLKAIAAVLNISVAETQTLLEEHTDGEQADGATDD